MVIYRVICCKETVATNMYQYGHTLSLHDAFPIWEVLYVRLGGEALHRRGGGPGQLLPGPEFGEGHEPAVVVEQDGAQVHDLVEPLGPGKPPALAPGAEEVPRRAMQPADRRPARCHREAAARPRQRERIGAGVHPKIGRALGRERRG